MRRRKLSIWIKKPFSRASLGSLEVNKKADLLILSKNPYQVDPMDLESIEVVETIMDGHSTNLLKLSKVSGGKFLVFDDWSPA